MTTSQPPSRYVMSVDLEDRRETKGVGREHDERVPARPLGWDVR